LNRVGEVLAVCARFVSSAVTSLTCADSMSDGDTTTQGDAHMFTSIVMKSATFTWISPRDDPQDGFLLGSSGKRENPASTHGTTCHHVALCIHRALTLRVPFGPASSASCLQGTPRRQVV
jgi:hypothetical protein